ncbi:MAG: oxygen-independent coproporphyrinogen III oxidase [Flavobacteriales bacterium]|nr:oxygen-independent coproporphyrinogen III oxidase [Flavobacteriia bacterium]NCP05297.1 oxygen-independent coproporphyrinogen III oxidase [Flavobacteriales bacterium]PIV93052.1 MAG: oxygen-independent coproporphyrinogen III oxidase [Flavobacteriaceae bacterium CG17_big_fil_post_rev_8_21_14_2_50_33_15]PIY11856.1 MAG: oxygen-independent coproporphyrinogen III oxidase [Flavobacteriaceae bacterium CG_4_10_14_3_um_filter_33_47]PJB18274.1 MAG: oxygen-independent coproporphyrinogen III oxidase [Flav
MNKSLVNKYNIAGPRYTSYPTVPYWNDDTFSVKKYKESLITSFNESNANEGISLYIHMPFCESLCTFCGCNKRITKQHDVESPYIEAVLKEWQLYLEMFNEKPIIKELHLGGGTPTFFKPENLKRLINGILNDAFVAEGHEFSFEGHPNNTTKAHLKALFDVGFNRVSFGVQDYNSTVQKAIHRIQPFENVKRATELAREIGYASVGHDIIFGLPFQTLEHVEQTILKTKELAPDRLAFYSYAHVPWIKGNGQRGFKDSDLPKAELKRQQYELGKQLLTEVGYHEIGMDHFALPSDSLYKSMQNKSLHRNFMGYTASKTQTMIGLGVSSIGDSWYGFGQNVKVLEEYYELLEQNKLPVYRGHVLNDEDLIIRRHILNLMCSFETSWELDAMYFPEIPEVLMKLKEMEHDSLLEIHSKTVKILPKGQPFVRNICMAFDLLLQRKTPDVQLFSMTV